MMGNIGSHSQADSSKPYSEFIQLVQGGQISEVEIDSSTVHAKTRVGIQFETYNPGDPHLVDDLLANDVAIKTKPPESQSFLRDVFVSWSPMLFLILIWIYFMRRSQGGGLGSGGMKLGESKAKLLQQDQMKVTFADVAGVEEAKEEVAEIVDFLRDPGKFEHIGGKIPRGALMVGPPGTGKTLLARAIAGEAKVPFFTISGSDFVEMFVGVGASRVRDMFDQAKKHAPCIIFIDEIDAVGRQRGAGLGGGHDEREQTLNQLLVEMDGFEANQGIIIIAATNRPDILDKALLRPGRFDRQVTVGLPDVRGREQILNVHMRKVPAGDDVELKYIARGTPGFTGADLANLVNEAALFAARNNKQTVGMTELEKAKDKIIMGVERRTLIMSEDERKLTAYHEAGHCIVGRLVPEHDPVYKVSIMPRGRALGVTLFLPERDQYSASRQKLESQISSLFGGRIAEKLIFGAHKVTTGASNDIERATDLARNMVTKWGLSERLGPLTYSEEQSQPFLGGSMTQTKSISEKTARTIDEEIRSVVDRNYEHAETILQENISILHEMAKALLEWETIDRWQIDDLMAGRKAGPPRDRNAVDRSEPSTSDAKGASVFPGGPIPGHAAVRADHRKFDRETKGWRNNE
ncbi:MAG: ATP-dependent zinc metalloprotease FtsH [Methylococcales bacterium]